VHFYRPIKSHIWKVYANLLTLKNFPENILVFNIFLLIERNFYIRDIFFCSGFPRFSVVMLKNCTLAPLKKIQIWIFSVNTSQKKSIQTAKHSIFFLTCQLKQGLWQYMYIWPMRPLSRLWHYTCETPILGMKIMWRHLWINPIFAWKYSLVKEVTDRGIVPSKVNSSNVDGSKKLDFLHLPKTILD